MIHNSFLKQFSDKQFVVRSVAVHCISAAKCVLGEILYIAIVGQCTCFSLLRVSHHFLHNQWPVTFLSSNRRR